ncbi:MAG TPA: 4-alpha-glucanotransferase [Steroidobacteraceae bacterium]|nr:4-alpha-glucanotransferase [Steroidobacteraceae bacterium]
MSAENPMAAQLAPLIERLARARGIGDAYHSYKGELKKFPLATKAAILRAMHCRLDDAAALEAQIAESESVLPVGLLGDVAVLRTGARAVRVNTPAIEQDALLRWRVLLEQGGGRTGEVRAWSLPERGAWQRDGRWFMLRDLPLPEDLPPGYHTLEIELEHSGSERCPLIVAPDRAHQPAELAGGGRLWGVAAQLYTLRSEHNWGIGDFTDLAELLRLASAAGAGFVGVSPLHAMFPSDPMLYSPYSASSRHALNVMFIDVNAVPDVRASARAQALIATRVFTARLKQVRAATRVDYGGVAALKLPVLEAAWQLFREKHMAEHTPRASQFREFLHERGEPLRLHALFDALDRHFRKTLGTDAGWQNWPREYHDPVGEPAQKFARDHAADVEFFLYLQWLAAEQLSAVRHLARELHLGVGIYGDYAVGVNASGSETWSDQALYCMGAAIGAPPDPLGVAGQEWGIPPQDPRQLRRAAYAPFTALVRASMRNCGALRLDHVMALFRQWWVPRGFKSVDGGYVHYPLEDLLGVVALESHRNECLVVGEDLGVVPDEIRRALPQFGVFHYKVVMFEQRDGEFVPPREYVRPALATVTTHDLPTLRGWWTGHDIDLWEKLGFYADSSVGVAARAERTRERLRLLRALRREGLWPEDHSVETHDTAPPAPAYSPELAHAVHLYLGRSEAALVTVQLEDMIGMLEPVNIPGTSSEYSNWTRRMTESAREIFARDDVRELAAAMSASRIM